MRMGVARLAVIVIMVVPVLMSGGVVLAAHLSRIARKTRCRTSISATLMRLRTARSYDPVRAAPVRSAPVRSAERRGSSLAMGLAAAVALFCYLAAIFALPGRAGE